MISATTPFAGDDVTELAADAPAVVRRLFPDQEAEYARRGWLMFPRIDRVYVNARARAELGWSPRYDFRSVLDRLKADEDPAQCPGPDTIGAKGYHRHGSAWLKGPMPSARALGDWARGKTDPEIFERDDGLHRGRSRSRAVRGRLRRAGSPAERRSMRYVRGRVVDVGCAAGRVPLYLQERGHDVVGLDSSPLAVRTAARPRREEAWCMSAEALTTRHRVRSTPSSCSATTSGSSAPPTGSGGC